MRRRRAGGSALFAAALALPAAAQVTSRVSLGAGGAQGDLWSTMPSITSDGRWIAFTSTATNFVPGDTNGDADIFVRDRQAGTTERVSVDSSGAQANSYSAFPSISDDGRYVAFLSNASNLVAGDTNGREDVFVRDRQSGVTTRVSVSSGGAQADAPNSHDPLMSADGRFVAFSSYATNLVAGDTNSTVDCFVHDRQSGTTERVSVDSSGAEVAVGGFLGSISADGRYVTFTSGSTNVVPGDTNNWLDAFVRDRSLGTVERVSLSTGGAQGDDDSYADSISSDGRYVVFRSLARNLVGGDTNNVQDVFVRDRTSNTTERVSVDSNEVQGDDWSDEPGISASGRYVAFNSFSDNLVPGHTGFYSDVFVRDLQSGTTELASVDTIGAQGNGSSFFSSISPDGRFVAFSSFGSNLVVGDTNADTDAFLRDRAAVEFTSQCSPGAGGVIACPCANPPSDLGRGCNNSSGTGGASLTAFGGAHLSSDSLIFRTAGEKPVALSIVLQGTSSIAAGVVYGQGVRCLGGVLKRLYTKNASGGSITAPEFAAGNPAVSARSAALGDSIVAGQSRWYLVYYRDGVILGGCPTTSTFSATQTGEVHWSP